MRVISGKSRGMKLESVPGMGTRPTTDRVKESLFSMIQPLLDEARFLDLFAGNGGIGIEALSRNAECAVFVEANFRCTKTIKANLEKTRLCGEVYTNDVFRAISILSRKGREFDIIFLDPPYNQGLTYKTLLALSEHNILRTNGLVIAEYGRKEEIPDQLSNFRQVRKESYGDTVISFFKLEEDYGEGGNMSRNI